MQNVTLRNVQLMRSRLGLSGTITTNPKFNEISNVLSIGGSAGGLIGSNSAVSGISYFVLGEGVDLKSQIILDVNLLSDTADTFSTTYKGLIITNSNLGEDLTRVNLQGRNRLYNKATVRFRVINYTDGKAISNANVTMFYSNGSKAFSQLTAANGSIATQSVIRFWINGTCNGEVDCTTAQKQKIYLSENANITIQADNFVTERFKINVSAGVKQSVSKGLQMDLHMNRPIREIYIPLSSMVNGYSEIRRLDNACLI
jgi:hypothetical protein